MAKCKERKSLCTMLKFSPQNCVFYQTEIHGTVTLKKCITHGYYGCTNCVNLEMEPAKYLLKNDIQLKLNISRTLKDKMVL